MPQLDTANKLLQSIHEEANLYWRDNKRPFTSLTAFLSGYQAGFFVGGTGFPISPLDLLPEDFPRFVTKRFARRFPAGDKCWQECIEGSTKSEEQAFALFFKLRGEYDKAKKRAAKPARSPRHRRAWRRRVRQAS